MLEFIFTLLVFAALIGGFIAVCKACEQIAAHMRGNPEAMKAVIEHVFVPLFARRDRTRQVTLEVIDVDKRPEESSGEGKPSNAA